MSDISLVSPVVFEFGGVHVTNTVLGGFVATLMAIVLIVLVATKPKLVPTRLQLLFEMMINAFMGFLISAYGEEKRAKKWLPFYVTIFFFLLIANQFSVFPLITSIVYGEEKNLLLRISTADFSQTITLALVVVILAHVVAFSISPIKHINNFLKFDKLLAIRGLKDVANYLLEIFLGVMDIIGEFSKIISLSARLFGNIFAGEVMVAVIAGLSIWTSYVVPIPFIFLGMFSSLVQAFVFAILAIQFMAGTIRAAEPAPSAVK